MDEKPDENPYGAPQEKPSAEPDYASMTSNPPSTVGRFLFWFGATTWLWSLLYMEAHRMDPIGPEGFVAALSAIAFFGSPIVVLLAIILRILGRTNRR